MYTFRDMTFCTDNKCLRTVCFRHPSGLRENIDNLPVAMSDFNTCEDRIHLKGDSNESE